MRGLEFNSGRAEKFCNDKTGENFTGKFSPVMFRRKFKLLLDNLDTGYFWVFDDVQEFDGKVSIADACCESLHHANV